MKVIVEQITAGSLMVGTPSCELLNNLSLQESIYLTQTVKCNHGALFGASFGSGFNGVNAVNYYMYIMFKYNVGYVELRMQSIA